MKWIKNIIGLTALASLVLSSCDKEGDLPFYNEGKAVTVGTSTNSVAASATDSQKVVLTVNWDSPNYATDEDNYKFLVQVDSAGRDWSKAVTREVMGEFTTEFTAKELNDIMLGFGFDFNKKYGLQLRVLSSYGNNNERYASNVVNLDGTPYKVPPKVALPASGTLLIVGSGTDFGWANNSSDPYNVARGFSKLDETTYAGIFRLVGGEQYLILPEYGNWDKKYALEKNNLPDIALAGSFGYNENNTSNFKDNFVTPASTGYYKITLDFQRGTFKVEAFTQEHGLPTQLVVVGDGTPQDWNNSVDNPYKFTRITSSKWEQVVTLNAGKAYLVLPEPGNWDKKFGADDNSTEASKFAGVFKPQGSDFKTPGETAKYKITLEFSNNRYTVVKQ